MVGWAVGASSLRRDDLGIRISVPNGGDRAAHIYPMSAKFLEADHPRDDGGKFAVKRHSEQDRALTAMPGAAEAIATRWHSPLEPHWKAWAAEQLSNPYAEEEYLDLAARHLRRCEEAAVFFETHGQAGVDDARVNAPELVLTIRNSQDEAASLAERWREQGRSLMIGGGDSWVHTPVHPAPAGYDTPYRARVGAEVEATLAWEQLAADRDPAEVTSKDIAAAYNEPVPQKMLAMIRVARPDVNIGQVQEIGRGMRHAGRLAGWFHEAGVDALTDADANRPDWLTERTSSHDWEHAAADQAEAWRRRVSDHLGGPSLEWKAGFGASEQARHLQAS